MKMQFRLPLVFALVWTCHLSGAAQPEMWPGDANNNGVVNGVDLLFHGLAYDSEGPERTNGNTQWQGQEITTLWEQSFPNGLDYAYADGDGDGTIDDDDKDAIENNFTLTHGEITPDPYTNAAAGSAPRILLVPDATVVEEGALVNVELVLGEAGMPVQNFYGIAFKLSYDAGLLADDDGIEFDPGINSWITAGEGDVEELFIPTGSGGQAELAITRTNQQAVPSGSGSIGSFSIIIEDIIVGLEVDTFRLRIDSVLLIDNSLNVYPAVPDTARIIVAKDSALVSASAQQNNLQARVFPNPASGICYVQCSARISHLRLADALGRTAPLRFNLTGEYTYQAEIPKARPGVYWLLGQTTEGTFRRKIIIY